MRKVIGYRERARNHREANIHPKDFFEAKSSSLERFVSKLGGTLKQKDTREINPFEDIGISVLNERKAIFEIPNRATITLKDYSRISTVDCFPIGTDYTGKIEIEFNDKNKKLVEEIETFCDYIFPINQEILQYLGER